MTTPSLLVALMGIFDRKASNPGRAPMTYNHRDAQVWIDGYQYAMHEAAQDVAREIRKGAGA